MTKRNHKLGLWKLSGVFMALTLALSGGAQTCEIEVLKSAERQRLSTSSPKGLSPQVVRAFTEGESALIYQKGLLKAFQRMAEAQNIDAKSFERQFKQMSPEQRETLARDLWKELLAEYLIHMNEKDVDYAHILRARAEELKLPLIQLEAHQKTLRDLVIDPQQTQEAIRFIAALLPTYARYTGYLRSFQRHTPKSWRDSWDKFEFPNTLISALIGLLVAGLGGAASVDLGATEFIQTSVFSGILLGSVTLFPGTFGPPIFSWAKNKTTGLYKKWKMQSARRHLRRAIQRETRHLVQGSEREGTVDAAIRRLKEVEDQLENSFQREEIEALSSAVDIKKVHSIEVLGQELETFLMTVMARIAPLVAQGDLISKEAPLQKLREHFRQSKAQKTSGADRSALDSHLLPVMLWIQRQQPKSSDVLRELEDLTLDLQAMDQKAVEMIAALEAAQREGNPGEPAHQAIQDKLTALQHLRGDVLRVGVLLSTHIEHFNGLIQQLASTTKLLRQFQLSDLEQRQNQESEVETQVQQLAEKFVEME